MSELLNKAFEAINRLPSDQQDAIAREILDRLASDARWDEALADPRSGALLRRLAGEARDDIATGDVLDCDPANRSR